jgi:hypothetical protein
MSYLDECSVYVFVRQDIPLPQQLVQAAHAVFGMTSLSPHGEGSPNIIVIGMPHLASLLKAAKKLKAAQVPHFDWHEPDGDLGFTAIATLPLHGAQKEPLANYRLWRYSPPASVVPSMASGEPCSRSSETVEHSVTNGEVTGSIPVESSISSSPPWP